MIVLYFMKSVLDMGVAILTRGMVSPEMVYLAALDLSSHG